MKDNHQNDPEITFHPNNSNFQQAVMMTNNVIKQLKKNNQLELFNAEIQNKICIGTLKKVEKEELKEILQKAHHFCYISLVQSENSETSQVRMINNTKTKVPSMGSSFCLANKVPVS